MKEMLFFFLDYHEEHQAGTGLSMAHRTVSMSECDGAQEECDGSLFFLTNGKACRCTHQLPEWSKN